MKKMICLTDTPNKTETEPTKMRGSSSNSSATNSPSSNTSLQRELDSPVKNVTTGSTGSSTTTTTTTTTTASGATSASSNSSTSTTSSGTATGTTTTTTSSNGRGSSTTAGGRGSNAASAAPGEGAMSAPSARQVPKRRMRRRATSQSQDPAEQLTEMSVRGLNLFRYASISEGVYQCTECAKLDIQKTFKNKYSFQRHAFLYHEGHQRKVFPCPVCGKEFSRPDKMKNHMKTVHDCFMPKDCVMPFGFFLPP